MTSRENLRLLLDHRAYERVAFHDNIWSDTLQRWVQEGYPQRHGVPQDPVDALGFDIVMVGGIDPMPIPGGEQTVEETETWAIRRNGAGACHKYWKSRSGAPEHVSFSMTSRELWEAQYRPHLTSLDRQRISSPDISEAFARARAGDLFLCFHNAFLWENLRSSVGDLCMLESLSLDPAWIDDYNRVYTDFYKTHYRWIFETFGLPDGISVSEDLAYNKGLLCSPRMLEAAFLPYFSELVAFFHGYGLSVTIHSDGNIAEAIPVLIDAGFDAINPMEVKAGCDPLQLAERYGSRIAFKGGLDARVLETGDLSLIRREVTRLVCGMRDRGAGFIFGSDHSVSTRVSLASYLYAVDVYRENAECRP